MRIVNPMNEAAGARETSTPPARLDTLKGKRIALLDISKPGGSHFLGRLAHLLHDRYGVETSRFIKPTFTKPAPDAVIAELAAFDAVIEGLAD
jgi:hypothetical protein